MWLREYKKRIFLLGIVFARLLSLTNEKLKHLLRNLSVSLRGARKLAVQSRSISLSALRAPCI